MITAETARSMVEQVDALRAEGKNAKDAAIEAGTAYSTYCYWRSRLRKGKPLRKERSHASLVEIPVDQDSGDDRVSIVLIKGNASSIKEITANLASILGDRV